jgi:hypothetical protein
VSYQQLGRDTQEIEEPPARLARPGAAADLGAGVLSSVAGSSRRPSEVLALQRQIGNASVGRLLRARAGAPAGARARADGPQRPAVTTLPESSESTHTRELTEDEIKASQAVHGEHLIPYGKTRVDQHSYLVRLGKWVNQLFGDKNASERAITTFHIIHAPEVLDIETAVHELTHVAQYEHVGAVSMPQALHGQSSEMGYNYGDLAKAHTEGKHYKDFNREQQAQIAEDYYLVKHGRAPSYGGTAADLQPFIDEMRAGAF